MAVLIAARVQYTSWAFTDWAGDSGLVPSMGSIGDRHANRKNAAMTAMQTATMTAMLRATIAHRWDAASLRRAEAP